MWPGMFQAKASNGSLIRVATKMVMAGVNVFIRCKLQRSPPARVEELLGASTAASMERLDCVQPEQPIPQRTCTNNPNEHYRERCNPAPWALDH